MPNFFSKLVQSQPNTLLTSSQIAPVVAQSSQPVAPKPAGPSPIIKASNFFSSLLGSHTINIDNTKPTPVVVPDNKVDIAKLAFAESTNNPQATNTGRDNKSYNGIYQMGQEAYKDVNVIRAQNKQPILPYEKAVNDAGYADTYINVRIPQLLKAISIPDSKQARLAYYVGWLPEYQKANGDISKMPANAQTYFKNVFGDQTVSATPTPTPQFQFPPLVATANAETNPPAGLSKQETDAIIAKGGQVISPAVPKSFIQKVGDFFNKLIPGKPLEEIPNQDVPGQMVVKVPFMNRGIQTGSNGADQVLGGLLQLPEQFWNTLKDIHDVATKGQTTRPDSPSKFDLKVQTEFDNILNGFDEAKRAGFSDAGASVIAVTKGVAGIILTLAPVVDASARGVLALTGYDKPVADALFRLGLDKNFTFEGWAKQTQRAVDSLVTTQDIAGARQLIDDTKVIASALQDKGISQATGVVKYIQDIASKVVEPLGAQPLTRFSVPAQPAESLPGYRYSAGQSEFSMGLSVKQVEKVGYAKSITPDLRPAIETIAKFNTFDEWLGSMRANDPIVGKPLTELKLIFNNAKNLSTTFGGGNPPDVLGSKTSKASRAREAQSFMDTTATGPDGFNLGGSISPEEQALAKERSLQLVKELNTKAGSSIKPESNLPQIQPELFIKNDSKVAEVQQAILNLSEVIDNSPVKQLSKYVGKSGNLPEVTGKRGAGKYAQRGDQFMSELGFEYTQDAVDAYDVYKASKAQLANLKKELKLTKAETFVDYSQAQLDKINSLLQRTVNTADELKAKVSKLLPPTVGGRSVSITPEGKKFFSRNRGGVPETKIARTESSLLRKQIMDEARGSKVGYKAGSQITKEQIVNQFRQSEAKINTLRDLVSTYIQDKLPVEARGKFLQALVGDITTRRAFSLFDRADRVVMNMERSKLIAEIKDLRIPKMGDSHIAVDYQKRLIETFKGIDLTKPSEATITRLKSLQAYLQSNQEALQIHPELLTRLERLSRTALRDMSTADLKELKDTIEHLQNLGRLKVALKNKYNARVRQVNLKKLLDSTKNRDPHFKDKRNPNLIERRYLDSIRAYMSTLHTPRVADYIDDFKGYQGENAKMTKRVAIAETNAQNNSKAIVMKALEEIQHLGVAEVTEDMQRNISINLLKDQGATDQVDTLLKKFGMDKAPELSDHEQKMADIVRKAISQFTNEIGAVYEEIENLPFQAVENYFPIKYEKEAHIIPSETINQTRNRTTKTEQGFTKTRIKNVERIPRTDFLAVFDEAVKDQQWYLNIQPELENMKYLVKSQEYLDKGGELASNFWKDYLDMVSRRGGSASAQPNQFLKETRIKINDGMLAYKVSTIILQPLALFDGLAMTQARYGSLASLEMFKEFTKAWFVPGYSKNIIANSPALQNRSGGELAIMENMESMSQVKGWYNTFKKGGMALIQAGDVKTASGVQQGIENVLIKNKVPNAHQEAEFLMNLMQGSAEVAYRPLILSKGEGVRTWFTFQTFALNRWGIIANDLFRGGIVQKGAVKRLNALIGLMVLVAGVIAENEARKGVKHLLTGKTSGDRSAFSVALGAIPEQVPFFGNLVSSFIVVGDPSADTPITSVLSDTIKGAGAAITGATPYSRINGGIKFTRSIMAGIFGVPGTFQMADMATRFLNPPPPPKTTPQFESPFKSGTGGFPKLGGSSGFPKLK